MVVRKAVDQKGSQKTVRAAIDGAREDVAKDMMMMTIDEFISAWVKRTYEKLDEWKSLHTLPRMSALKVFRESVSEGCGIPLIMTPQMKNINVNEWRSLTNAVNRLFDDDPEPPPDTSQGQGYKKKWNNDWNNASTGAGGWAPAKGMGKGDGKSWTMGKGDGKGWTKPSWGQSWTKPSWGPY